MRHSFWAVPSGRFLLGPPRHDAGDVHRPGRLDTGSGGHRSNASLDIREFDPIRLADAFSGMVSCEDDSDSVVMTADSAVWNRIASPRERTARRFFRAASKQMATEYWVIDTTI
jgi:hypothetical protein